jgi:hypothetical protein
MIFEVLTAVKVSTLVFWVVTPCGLVDRYQHFIGTYFSPEDGGSMLLRNVGIYLQIYKVLQPRRPMSTGFELFSRKLVSELAELK